MDELHRTVSAGARWERQLRSFRPIVGFNGSGFSWAYISFPDSGKWQLLEDDVLTRDAFGSGQPTLDDNLTDGCVYSWIQALRDWSIGLCLALISKGDKSRRVWSAWITKVISESFSPRQPKSHVRASGPVVTDIGSGQQSSSLLSDVMTGRQ